LKRGAGFTGGRKDVWRAEASAAAPPPVSSPCLISNKSGLQDFNQQMNYRQAALFLKNSPHHIHEAARKDCEERNCSLESYLKVSRRAAFSFIATKDRIWDRECLKERFADLLSDSCGKGNLVFFSGGKSFGKSVLLNSLNLPKGSNGVILRLDGRNTGSDFQYALRRAVATHPEFGRVFVDVLFSETLLEDAFEAAGIPFASQTAKAFRAAYKAAYGKDPKNENKLNAIERMEKALTVLAETHHPLTIIIDEANIYFKEAKEGEVKDILALIVRLTKQNSKLNVIIASSENSFPYELRRLGVNMADLRKHYIIGDLSPKDTYKLLTEQWYLGPNLAAALINLYGGHLYTIANALSDFYVEGESYEPIVSYGPVFQGQVELCLDECLSSENERTRKRIVPALKTLAETGFLEMTSIDPIAKSIAKHNVGGFVPKEAFAPSIPKELRKRLDGVVPSSQMMRMVIASAVTYHEDKELQQ